MQLDSAGQLSVAALESFGASALTGPSRPEAFAVRLHLPGISPLFYWFDVAHPGPLGPYQVYNDSYSTGYSQWVGGFDAKGPTRRQTKPDAAGQRAEGVAPVGGKVLRWLGQATLERAANRADGRRQYTLGLVRSATGRSGVGAAVARPALAYRAAPGAPGGGAKQLAGRRAYYLPLRKAAAY
ncbi:hypothetical protein [Hymenobacter coccineus]|uniref:Uncharacterized protein n=1 Tax=Hymenobacter coccineus TaxID=1908235 RepID=A0A1G1TK83_9BACT|nr:hypothetical protein [Hymenobacter coccineus]OGX91280.1 hypothetical protein BEN49_20395 [Hymenobacter coccineus]